MQNIQITGNLVKDANEFTRKDTGVRMMQLRVACHRYNGTTRITSFYDVYAKYSGTFELLKKGCRVFASGEPFLHNGDERSDICISCSVLEVQLPPKTDQAPKQKGFAPIDFNRKKL
jgi:hypothetical protein